MAGPARCGRWWGFFIAPILALVIAATSCAGSAVGDDVIATGRTFPASGSAVVEGPRGFWPSTSIWTGRALVGFGTARRPNDRLRVLVYDAVRGTWQRVPRPPVREPLYNPIAVWTGRRVVLLGIRCIDRAGPDDDYGPECDPGQLWTGALDLGTRRWRKLTSPIGGRADSLGLRTVGQVGGVWVVAVGDRLFGFRDGRWTAVGAFDVAADTLCATTRRIIRRHRVNLAPSGVPFGFAGPIAMPTEVAELDTTGGGWRSLGAVPSDVSLEGSWMSCGAEVLVVTADFRTVMALDAANRWRRVPPPARDLVEAAPDPARPAGAGPLAEYHAWSGRDYLWWSPFASITELIHGPPPWSPTAFAGFGLRYSPDRDSWSTMPPTFGPSDLTPVTSWTDGALSEMTADRRGAVALRVDPRSPAPVVEWQLRLQAANAPTSSTSQPEVATTMTAPR